MSRSSRFSRTYTAGPLSLFSVTTRRSPHGTTMVAVNMRFAGTGIDAHERPSDDSQTTGGDGWVIGRLVPSGVGELSMFDMTPLAVAEHQAGSVAATSRGWLGLGSRLFLREDYELLSDVQGLDLIRYATSPSDLPRVMADLREGRDEVARAAYRTLDRALAGDLAAGDQAYVAAAALQPGVQDDLRRKLVRAGHPEPWVTWAARTPNPARGHLLALAEAARATA